MQLFPLHRFAYQFVHRVIQKMRNESFPFNNKGFGGGGGGQMPAVPAAPPVAPSPVPTAASPTSSVEGRQQQVAMLKYGQLATMTNSGGSAGIAGAGPDMYPSMTPGTTGRQTTGGS